MSRLIDETGNTYGRLTVTQPAGRDYRGTAMWECLCECGKTHIVNGTLLRSGRVKSCGCYKIDWPKLHKTTHGMNRKGQRHPIHRVWTGMKTRCYNDKEPCWKNYGGRGIKVCAEWQEFVPFMKWALANGYRPGLEIDRRDNDGDYSPDNCRFVTTVVNMRNKRNNHPITIGGETRILAEWAEISGLHHTLVLYRLREGWDEEDLLVPVGTYHNYANPRVKKVLEEALV